MENLLKYFKCFFVFLIINNNSYAFVTPTVPTSSSILNQMSNAMSHSVVNSAEVINNSNNVTSNMISSTELKKSIEETADKLGLEIDEDAANVLSDASSNTDKKEVAKAMDKMKDNIEIGDDEKIMTINQDTILYDSGWFDLEKVTTGSNGLAYSSDKNVFQDGGTQKVRSKVYVNFIDQEISADVFTKVTLKGASTVNHNFNTGTAGITSLPVVASTVMGLKSDGSTDFDEFVGINPSMKASADTLAPNYNDGLDKQELMDWYNHDTNNSDADKRLFLYGKFTTVGADGSRGSGFVAIEGAHEVLADSEGPLDMNGKDGEERYLDTVERYEGTAIITGKAME